MSHEREFMPASLQVRARPRSHLSAPIPHEGEGRGHQRGNESCMISGENRCAG